jgi:hypothetical protein
VPTAAPAVSNIREKGTLIIKSNPTGAELIVDGNSIGNTPAEIQLTAEPHVIELKKDVLYWSDKVTIESNKVKNMNPILQAPPTRIEIVTDPIESKVYINDKSYGYSPIKQDFEPGKYKIKVVKGGYKVYEDEVIVQSNKTSTFDISLEKIIKPPIKSRFGISLFNTGAALKWTPGVLGFEARAASQDNINIAGGRLYINFNPRSKAIVYMGFEGDNISGETAIQKFEGTAGGGFLGMEFIISKHLSVNMDIGQYDINIRNKEIDSINVDQGYLIGNVGFNIYF